MKTAAAIVFPLILGTLVVGSVAAQSARPRKDIPAIAEAANGAIVSIIMSDKDGHTIAQGTGFLTSKDGRIVTNYHVIENGSSAIVKLPDGAFYVVDGVLASDRARDVAVIKAHGKNFHTLALGNSDQVQVGEAVVAIGNPLSLESTVSNGIVSGIRTAKELGGKFLQVTTPISPGSSGGPLFNMAGEVVGITSLYLEGGENLNFAIPINDAKRLLWTKSTAIRALPNEPEAVDISAGLVPKARTDSGEIPPLVPATAAKTNPSDRDHYQQLYDAGGFAHQVIGTAPDGSKTEYGRIRDVDYVCFSDDAYSGTFFTFTAHAYDENYSKAGDIMEKMPGSDEVLKQYRTQLAIQQQAPYVDFMPDSISLKSWSPDAQQFFQRGGRILEENVYDKGVKTNTLQYHWGGSSWFYPIPPADPNAYSRTSKILQLSIEPASMRYVESTTVTITVGSGDTAANNTSHYGPWAGVCEKIPDPK